MPLFDLFGYFRSYVWLLESTSWLLLCGILWVAKLLITPFFVFYYRLEPKVPDCAGYQYMKLAFNPRSILLNPCVNDLSLTQYGLPFNLVVVVVNELRQHNFLYRLLWQMFSHGTKCTTTRVLCVSIISMSVTLPHPPFQHWFTWDVNLCIQI
jgi:hypothetical protein